MSGIIPIPTTRVGDLFVRQRLASQVQQDQLALFRLQNQISTGRRIQLPSEDAPAALRAINLQRLLDRKGQIKTNLLASNQYLSGAESQLISISDTLVELRGIVVGVAGNVNSDGGRTAALQAVDRALEALVNAGNAKMGGRSLFAGSRSQVQPYDYNGNFVEYSGNEGVLRSYVDLERLFETNLAGTDVFGGISAAVEGSVDLDPQVRVNTLASTLNGGSGIGPNPAITISVNDGLTTTSSVVDLSGAVTLADIARLIEEGAPAGSSVTAEINGTGLVLRAAGGDTISVSETAEGHTARLLGILSDPDILATDTITGLDLNPAVLKTTRLSDLLGTKATGRIQLPGNNNDLRLTATVNGGDFNDVDIVFVGGAVAGSESAVYNQGTKTLTISIQDGISTGEQVAAAITAEGHFAAAADYHDATSSVQAGTGTITLGGSPSLSFVDATQGGSGESLDITSGLHLTNAGQSMALDTSAAETVEDLLNLINGSAMGLLAEVNASRDGINVRSKLSGADFMIGENGGSTATQLGLRTYTGDTQLAALNRGLGVPTTSALETLDTTQLDQLRIVARNGTTIDVDLTGATTLQDVVALVNGDSENSGATAVLARLTGGGNRIELVDSSSGATGRLRVELPTGTTAAQYLGFVPAGATQNSSTETDTSGNDVLGGGKVLGNDLAIIAANGVQLSIDLAGVASVQDVIDRINSNADNLPPVITAQLARVGNGIELIDSSGGAGTLTVQTAEGSLAAQYLGFVGFGETQSAAANVTVEGANQVLQSEDRNTFETDSVFNTLLRLRTALETNNDIEIGRSLDRLDVDINRLNFARAEIGGRVQNLTTIKTRLEDENVQLRAALSEDIDADLIEAVSELTARQYAFEASLRSSASLMQMTLLNFL